MGCSPSVWAYLGMVTPWGAGNTHLPQCVVLHGLQGLTPPPPSSLTLVFTRLILTPVSSSLFTALWCFLPSLKNIFQRHYHFGWWAQPCPAVGPLWSCLDLVMSSMEEPLVSSHRKHPCCTPPPIQLRWYPIKCTEAFITPNHLHLPKEGINTVELML